MFLAGRGTKHWTGDGRPDHSGAIPEAHKSGIRRYLETGKGEVLGRRAEVSGIKKNGDEFPLELSISPVLDDGRIVFVGCLRDISDRNALRLARADLARVRQRMAMGEMAASIAHEIKQPLAAIATTPMLACVGLGIRNPT